MDNGDTGLEALAWKLVDFSMPEPACQAPDSLWDVPATVLGEVDCLRAAMSRVIGLGVVAGAGLIKLPQIAAVVAARSAEGLALTSVAVEVFGYTYNLAAHVRQGYAVSTYGDFAVLLLQNYVLLALCFAYRVPSNAAHGLAAVAIFIALLMLLCSSLTPIWLLQGLTLANVPVAVAARVPQIYANWHNNSTGTLSAISSWGVFLGAVARIFTTLQDVDSRNILLGYCVSATLNGIVAFQCVWYSSRGKDRRIRSDGKKTA